MDIDSMINELQEGSPAALAAAGAVTIVLGATAISCCLRGGGDDKEEGSSSEKPASSSRGVVESEDAPTASSETKKKKKKKSKKKAAGGENGAQTETAAPAPTPVSAPDPASEPTPESTSAAAAEGGKKKKKKKKSKNKTGASGEAAQQQKTEPAKTVGFDDDDDDDGPLQPVAPPKTKQAEPSIGFASGGKLTKEQKADMDDGWVVEGAKNKKKKSQAAARKKAAAAAAAQQEQPSSAPASTEIKDYVTIEAKKIGILIGPKGSTLQSIQDATNTKIETPQNRDRDDQSPVKVIVTGSSPADVKKAKDAIKELCKKGYASILQDAGFVENYVSVHPQVLSEIVGPRGAVIKAIQEKLNVKVSIPSTDWKPGNDQSFPVKNARVGVAGSKEDCVMAKAVITSISHYHHHEITHPGLVHREVDVPGNFLNYVIGIKGSEIRHMKGNYKCDVYIPNAESYCENVLVVGRPEDADRAVKHIHNLMQRASEQSERRYDDEEY